MNTVTYRKRTREEITAWLNQARQRKESWEKETEQELKEIFSDRWNRAAIRWRNQYVQRIQAIIYSLSLQPKPQLSTIYNIGFMTAEQISAMNIRRWQGIGAIADDESLMISWRVTAIMMTNKETD